MTDKTAAPTLLEACRAQHVAIDVLFAMLIAKTAHDPEPFYPSESGHIWDALVAGNAAIKAAEDAPPTYTFAHLEAAACMWEYVLETLRRHRETRNPWDEYREAYGMAGLREKVILHAREMETHYQEAVANGYDKDFDWQYVPKYMEDHVTRILT